VLVFFQYARMLLSNLAILINNLQQERCNLKVFVGSQIVIKETKINTLVLTVINHE